MQTLLSGSAHTGVFVRTPDIGALSKALEKHNVIFRQANGGLDITGSKTDEIGEIAFAAKIKLHELSRRTASLEEAFLELTADAREYKAHEEGKS
jgi:ABC-2 type transport system ATP-binding protein